MGVPKFYRWISERYPCLSQVVKDYQIPEFDNFYLDMNGIIHSCSHPNDDDPSFRISEDKIFRDIFYYLEVLFRIVKPQKLLFMAIDGVAPRAKMNQQRGRRFRSAKDAEDLMRKAVAKGIDLPGVARFDSNCITPGTEFMDRLNEQFKYFINQKLATDQSWQRVEVVFSGHEVPGEGEHKIMDYIRYQKSQTGYDPNTRHCLYGLDADLIMLGMVTHEPHFSLLREEVVFGKSAKKQTNPEAITFHLLHLSILREYLDYEFALLKETLPFPYDLESIIDDWVLMGYLVGNDFIPNLPNFHIRQEVFPLLYKIYIKELPSLGGYINNHGTLNMERFGKYLSALAEFDYDNFAELIGGQRWKRGKVEDKKYQEEGTERGGVKEEEDREGSGDATESVFLFGALNDDPEEDTESIKKLKRDLGIKNMESFFDKEDREFKSNFDEEMYSLKCSYYRDKFDLEEVNDQTILQLGKGYVVGIQWVLSYYYTGVPSWSWFYPYHYAPYVSDIKGISSLVIEFEEREPFLPFEQLLAVLPPASRFLLPAAYQGLMVNDISPILDFYPLHFDTDLNGKQHEWEAVVLIPFIDEDRLLEAMKPLSPSLTEDEVRRNAHGPCFVYRFDKTLSAKTYLSPWPTQFPDVLNCKVRCTVLSSDPYAIPSDSLVTGLLPSVKLDLYFPGFPTLKHIPHQAFLESKGVRVFQAASRGTNMCMKILPRPMEKSLHDLAYSLIGKTCYVGWPYLVEAKVCGVSDSITSYYNEGYGPGRKPRVCKTELNPEENKLWGRIAQDITRDYIHKRGIELGDITVLVYAQQLQGKRYMLDRTGPRGLMTLSKQWSPTSTTHPLQTVVFDIYEHAPEYREKTKTLEDVFPEGSICFLILPPYYGEQAEVVSVDSAQQRVSVKFQVQPEPDMEPVIRLYYQLKERYYHQRIVAQELGLPVQVVGRIAASFKCERGSSENKKDREKFELGLNIKRGKRNQELVGYAQKNDNGWSLSRAAADLIKEYMEKFPTMFKFLSENPSEDTYYESNLFPADSDTETLKGAKEWIKSLPIHNMEHTECGSDTLNESHIKEIDKALAAVKNKASNLKQMKLKPSHLYKATEHQGGLIPDEFADYYVFDRVVNVASNGAVPFGLRGTITGIIYEGPDNKNTMYEVVFDQEFLGGASLRCSGNRAYKLPSSCLLNISYGKRWGQNNEHKEQQNRKQEFGQKNYSAAAASIPTPSGTKTGYHTELLATQSPRGGKESSYGNRSMEYVSDRRNGGQRRESKRVVPSPGKVEILKKPHQQTGNEFDQMLQSMQGLSTSSSSSSSRPSQPKPKNENKDSIKETTPQNLPSAPPDGLVKALQALPKVQLPSSDLRKPDLSTRESDVDKFTKTSLSTNSGGSKKPQAMSKHGPPDATTIFSNQPSMSSVPPVTSSSLSLNHPAGTDANKEISKNQTPSSSRPLGESPPPQSIDKIGTSHIIHHITTPSSKPLVSLAPPITSNLSSTSTSTSSASTNVYPPTLDALFKSANDRKNQSMLTGHSGMGKNEATADAPKKESQVSTPPTQPPLLQTPYWQPYPVAPNYQFLHQNPYDPRHFPYRGPMQTPPRSSVSSPFTPRSNVRPYLSHSPSSFPPPNRFLPPGGFYSPMPYFGLRYPMPAPPPHFLISSVPIMGPSPPGGYPRGPKPPPKSSDPTLPGNLNPSAIPFTPLQVERRQAKSKPKENTGPDSGRTQPVAQKENTESLNATPDKPGGNRDQTNQVTMNEVESHTESVLFEVDEAQETMLGLKSLMTGVDAMQEESSHYATGKGIGLVGSIEEGDEILANMDSAGEDEQLVDAIPSSDRGNDDTHPPVVVGEIVSHVHGGQSPPL